MARVDRVAQRWRRVATDGIFNAVLAQSTVLSFDRIGTCNGSPSAVWYSTDIRVTTNNSSPPWAGREAKEDRAAKGGQGCSYPKSMRAARASKEMPESSTVEEEPALFPDRARTFTITRAETAVIVASTKE